MLGGSGIDHVFPIYLEDNRFKYPTATSNQLQLFGSLPTRSSADPEIQFGTEQNKNFLIQPNKRVRDVEDFSRQQKLQISLNYNNNYNNTCQNEAVLNHNIVSTGLRLSYDDDEHNSSVTSASGSVAAPPSISLSLNDNIRNDLDRQKEDFDQYIKIQQQQLAKGVRDMKERHTASFLTAIEKGISKKLLEKDFEIENMNKKNKELIEKIKQVATEAQNWQYRAKYNESIVHILKNNLQQAISQGAEHRKEGFGDSEVDSAASSYINPNNYSRNHGLTEHMFCKACQRKEVSILVMPCRHLCLCTECDVFSSVCPVCQSTKTASVQVYLN